MKGGTAQNATQARPPHWNSSLRNIAGRIKAPKPGSSSAVIAAISSVERNEFRPPTTTSGLKDTSSPMSEREAAGADLGGEPVARSVRFMHVCRGSHGLPLVPRAG